MNVRELLKHILYYEVVEIRDFEGKNLIAIEDLDRFIDFMIAKLKILIMIILMMIFMF